MPTRYQRLIAPLAPKYDPRHVEAYMRFEHGTLDHLELERFRTEIRTACQCIDTDPAGAERLARSYGLKP